MESSATLGQRIQEGRKSAGLSQEALGEQLGVSRQAVSKWESDAAVPELENLIAMSRIFGVSIGALLGVEPPEVPEREHPLSEKELAAVEAIAAKYLSETEQFRPRRSRRQKVMAILAAVLAGALVLTLCSRCGAWSGSSGACRIRSTISGTTWPGRSAASPGRSVTFWANRRICWPILPWTSRTMISQPGP